MRLILEVGGGKTYGLTGDFTSARVAQGLSIWRVNVDDEIAGEGRFKVECDFPSVVGFGESSPTEAAKASWAFTNADFLARCKPVFGRGLL